MIVEKIFSVKGVAFTFLIILCIWIGVNLWEFDSDGNGFILGDWLVNYYDGGFKRRGLSGTIFFFLQDVTGLSLIALVYSAQMLLYLIFFFLLFKILKNKSLSLLFFTLIISPLTFFAYFNDTAMMGRKEVIFLIIFLYYLLSISENRITRGKEYLICLLLVIATFLHEITIFYIPYFMLAHFLIYKEFDVTKYLMFFLSCLIPALIIFFLGAKTNEGNSLDLLAQRGVTLRDHSIFSFTNDIYVQMDKYRENFIRYLLYIPSLFLGLVHFGVYMRKETDLKYQYVLLYFMLLIVYSFPLFFLACDWGRWLHIHFILLFLLLLFKLPNKNMNKIRSKKILSFLGRNFQYGLLIVFLIIWTIKHYDIGMTYRGFFYDVFCYLGSVC